EPRVASAVDSNLIYALGTRRSVVSIQPYLMAAFNGRRRRLARTQAWFVVQEPGRIALALLDHGSWRSIRVRQAGTSWLQDLPALLDGECAARDFTCHEVFVHAEDDVPEALGAYQLTDITDARGSDAKSK